MTRQVLWWAGTLYTPAGRPIVSCTWQEAVAAIEWTGDDTELIHRRPA